MNDHFQDHQLLFSHLEQIRVLSDVEELVTNNV